MDKWKPACDELNIFYSSLNVQLLLLLWLSKSTPQTSHNTTLMYYMQKRISSNFLQASVLWFIKWIYIHFEIIKLPFGMSTRYSKGGIPKYNIKQLLITSIRSIVQQWRYRSHQASRRRGNNARNFIHNPLLTDSYKSSATSRKHKGSSGRGKKVLKLYYVTVYVAVHSGFLS